jgi:hypothetical protein
LCFQRIACLPSKMVAKTASIFDDLVAAMVDEFE